MIDEILKKVLDSLNVAVVVLNEENQIILFNRMAGELLQQLQHLGSRVLFSESHLSFYLNFLANRHFWLISWANDTDYPFIERL